MALTPLTDEQVKKIMRNLTAACEDISKLNKTGYNYIYLCSGFIAHYDLEGFKNYYEEPGSLAKAILRHQAQNQWKNFRPGEENYEYYSVKAAVYNSLCAAIRMNKLAA